MVSRELHRKLKNLARKYHNTTNKAEKASIIRQMKLEIMKENYQRSIGM